MRPGVPFFVRVSPLIDKNGHFSNSSCPFDIYGRKGGEERIAIIRSISNDMLQSR